MHPDLSSSVFHRCPSDLVVVVVCQNAAAIHYPVLIGRSAEMTLGQQRSGEEAWWAEEGMGMDAGETAGRECRNVERL